MHHVTTLDLTKINVYWVGLSFMWNSLHVLILPALLLNFVPDAQKNTYLGLLTFFGLILAMFIQPLSGAISDQWRSRFGRRRPLMAIGTLADVLFLVLMARSAGLPGLMLGYLGLQISSNIAHGPAQGLMHDMVPPTQMGMASAFKNLFDMGGLVVASLAMGRIFSPQSPSLAFVIIIGIVLLGAAITIFSVREQSSVSISRRTLQHQFSGLQANWRQHSAFWRLIGARLLFLTGVYGVQTFAQYFVRDTLPSEDPIKLTGDLLATIVVALILFSLFAGHLCDRFGRKPLHRAAAALLASGSLLLMLADSPAKVLVFGAVAGAGIGVFLSANWALANDLAPKEEAGKFLGFTNLATAGAGALSRLAGPVIDALNNLQPGGHLGYAALFTCAALLAASSLLFLRHVPEIVLSTPAEESV